MLKNMKIRSRMLLSYLIIVVLLLVVGIVSIVMLSKVNNNLESFYENQFQTAQNAMDIRRTIFAIRSDILNAIADDDQNVTSSCIDEAQGHFTNLSTVLDLIYKTYAGDKSQLDKVGSNITAAKPYFDDICQLCDAGRNDEAYAIFTNNYKPLMDDVRSLMDSVGDTAEANAQQKVDDANDLASFADVLIIVMIAIAIAISVVLAILISNSVRKPVEEMNRVAKEMAGGKMDLDITYQSRDELGDMANDMRHMTDSVRRIIKDVDHFLGEMAHGNFTVSSNDSEAYRGDYVQIYKSMNALRDTMNDTLAQIDVAADQVSAGSDQVSTSAQALAQGATEQAASVQELAATINGVSHQVEETAGHAKTAKTEDMSAHEQIQLCSKSMDDLMGAMNDIETKSQDIGTVIKSIEDIAFQTNILALNAAVEAARAGSAGKGFAVVADEVRSLAAKSDAAAKNTAKLIESAISVIQDGVKLSEETRQSLEVVVGSAQKVLDAVTLISNATEEQSNSISQITVAVDQISSVVQTNSATSEQSAAASEELSSQATVLKQLIGKFRLSQSGGSSYGGSMSGSASPASDTDSFESSFGSSAFGGAKY